MSTVSTSLRGAPPMYIDRSVPNRPFTNQTPTDAVSRAIGRATLQMIVRNLPTSHNVTEQQPTPQRVHPPWSPGDNCSTTNPQPHPYLSTGVIRRAATTAVRPAAAAGAATAVPPAAAGAAAAGPPAAAAGAAVAVPSTAGAGAEAAVPAAATATGATIRVPSAAAAVPPALAAAGAAAAAAAAAATAATGATSTVPSTTAAAGPVSDSRRAVKQALTSPDGAIYAD